MKKLLFHWLFLCTLFCNAQVTEQDTIDMDTVYVPKNAVYIELGGNCLFYSLNYERQIASFSKFLLNFNMGISYPLPVYDKGHLYLHGNFNLLYGKKSSKVELALGGILDFNFHPYPSSIKQQKENKKNGLPYESVLLAGTYINTGYRYYFKNNIFLRFSFILFIDLYDPEVTPWGGISIGKKF